MEPRHILIVEDESNTADMLTSYFEAQGYEVTTVGWGKKALALVQDVLPDLVVLDIRLPDIDGYEVCRQLRSHRRTAHVPIIFLTERRERIDRLAGLELGAVDYVTKPFDIQELRLRVRNVLRRSDLRPVTHPVTGLPFSGLVEEQLSSLLENKTRAVLAVALDGLEPFADTYGFVARDDVLRAVSLMIKHVTEEETGKKLFIGQLDNGIFVLIIPPEMAGRVQKRLTERLRETLVFFYPRTDWEAGQDRMGDPLPLLSVRLGVLPEPVSCRSVEELRESILNSLPSPS